MSPATAHRYADGVHCAADGIGIHPMDIHLKKEKKDDANGH